MYMAGRGDVRADFKVHEIRSLGKSEDAQAKALLQKAAHQVRSWAWLVRTHVHPAHARCRAGLQHCRPTSLQIFPAAACCACACSRADARGVPFTPQHQTPHRAHAQVQPIMRRREWVVPLLTEFFPSNPCLLGLNVGGGGGRTREVKGKHAICCVRSGACCWVWGAGPRRRWCRATPFSAPCPARTTTPCAAVRLRPASDMTSFLPYESILGTMLHELVHNVRGPHDRSAGWGLRGSGQPQTARVCVHGCCGTR